MNHIWTQISYSFLPETHLKNQRIALVKNLGGNCNDITKGHFSKVAETAH